MFLQNFNDCNDVQGHGENIIEKAELGNDDKVPGIEDDVHEQVVLEHTVVDDLLSSFDNFEKPMDSTEINPLPTNVHQDDQQGLVTTSISGNDGTNIITNL